MEGEKPYSSSEHNERNISKELFDLHCAELHEATQHMNESPEHHAQSDISAETFDLFTMQLHEASKRLNAIINELPTGFPNRDAIVEHTRVLASLLPEIEEDWQ